MRERERERERERGREGEGARVVADSPFERLVSPRTPRTRGAPEAGNKRQEEELLAQA